MSTVIPIDPCGVYLAIGEFGLRATEVVYTSVAGRAAYGRLQLHSSSSVATLAEVPIAVVGTELGGSNSAAWRGTGDMLGERINSEARGTDLSIVIAVAATQRYILGRTTTGLVGVGKHLHSVASVAGSNLSVKRRHS